MSNLKVFKNEDLGEIRTTIIENKVWFVGKDVAIILGYSNPQKAIRDHVYQEDRTMNNSFTVNGTPITLVNESGIYSLILSSKMPNARKFKRWVTNEILPSIRKHGMYATEELILNPDLAIAAFTALKEERNKVQNFNKTIESQNQQLALQNQQITEMSSKASYYDVVLNCEDLVAISTISKDYGWSAKKMNAYLYKKGIQYKQGDIWLLYQKYAEYGYTSTKTHVYLKDDGQHTKVHTYWTQKGRLFIYELLKEDGIYPLIERNNVIN